MSPRSISPLFVSLVLGACASAPAPAPSPVPIDPAPSHADDAREQTTDPAPEPSDVSPKGWAARLGQTITLKGRAENAKMGALIILDGTASIWVADFEAWDDDVLGKRVEVTGTVIERHDQPVFVRKEGEPEMQGIPVPEGTDLEEASRRYLLGNVRWRLER